YAPRFIPREIEPLPGSERTQQTLFPISKGNREEDLAAAIRFYLPRTLNTLLRGAYDALNQELRKMSYLGPLRSYPSRHFAFSEDQDENWYAGGGHAWDVARKNATVRD